MKLFSYLVDFLDSQVDLDPNRYFLRSSRDEFRRRSVSMAVIPAGIATLMGATLNIVRPEVPDLELAIPELIIGCYFLLLALYYRFLPFKQSSALLLFIPIFVFWIFLFGNRRIDTSVIVLLGAQPVVCYFLFERKFAFLLSVLLMLLAGLAYLTSVEPNGAWIKGRIVYNVFFAAVVIIGTLHFYTGVQEKIENRLLSLANYDGLTGLGNLHYYKSRSVDALAAANRNKSELSLIMLDVDFFKKVNDTYGHDCGDVALKLIAAILKESVRPTETCFRLGGEEFVVMQPETSRETSFLIAERMREKIEATPLHWKGNEINLTASFGVATLHQGADNLDDLYANADQAMYRAKNGGRNRVEVAS